MGGLVSKKNPDSVDSAVAHEVAPPPGDPPGTFPMMLYGSKGEQKVVPDRLAQKKLGPSWKEHPE